MIEPNPRKTNSVRYLGPVDITRLREKVLALPDSVWDEQNASKPNRFETLGSTRHIVFRFLPKLSDWREAYDLPIWDEWREVLEPVLEQATADYRYERGAIPRVMLARLSAGGMIAAHRDDSRSAKWPHKIHVPITTNPDVVFFVGGTFVKLEEGVAVELNNMDVHSVENRGTTDRVHLIFEYFDLDQPEPAWVNEPPKRLTS